MKKQTLFFFSLTLVTASFIFGGCSKKDDDSSSTPAATCSDGIQNQGETGVDCGGPCTACVTALCNGNGQNSYFPLVQNNSWHYNGTLDWSVTINGTYVHNAVTYFKFDGTDTWTTWNQYRRVASNGDVIVYSSNNNYEYLEIPGSPVLNQKWLMGGAGSDSLKVVSLNATVTTTSCSYTGCLKIEERGPAGDLIFTNYYKKGIGLVRKGVFINEDLDAVSLH